MITVAIVEDDDIAAGTLQEYLAGYQERNQENFKITRFHDAISFLENYSNIYDIIFMDIELPELNGMDAAVKLRQIDEQIVLIFVTNLAKFAQKGYEVQALDFIVKPVSYPDFSLKFKKAIIKVLANKNIELTIKLANGFFRIASNKLLYVEISGHRLFYHLLDETIESYGSLAQVEKQLKGCGFLRCNSCFLINPTHIVYVKNYIVKVGNIELQISRPKRKSFVAALSKWYECGGGV